MKLPAEMTAKVKFKSGDQEYRFDFTFAEFSVDKAATAADAATSLFEVPDDLSEVLKLLDERVTLIGELVQQRRVLGSVGARVSGEGSRAVA